MTADLVLSMQKVRAPNGYRIEPAPDNYLDAAVEAAIMGRERDTPSHVYLGVVRQYLRHGYDVGAIDMGHIADQLAGLGYDVDAAKGTLHRDANTGT